MLSRQHKRAVLAAAALTLVVVVLLAAVSRHFENQSLARQVEEERASLVAPQPLIVTVSRQTLARDRTFAGRLEPWASATLAPEVAGTVLRLGAELGQSVAAGAELLALDDGLVRPSLAAASVQAQETARRAAEIATLTEGRVLAETDRLAAQAAADSAAQEVARLRELLARHTLRAPFAGSIQHRAVDVGDFLPPGQPAFVLVDTSRLRTVFHVSAVERASFPVGTAVTVEAGPVGTAPMTAAVRFVSPAAGPDGRFRVEAILDPAPTSAPAGSAAVVRAPVRSHVDTLFVPAAAIRFEGAVPTVHRLVDDVETAVAIEIGPEINGLHPVRAGLAEGDRLVIR